MYYNVVKVKIDKNFYVHGILFFCFLFSFDLSYPQRTPPTRSRICDVKVTHLPTLISEEKEEKMGKMNALLSDKKSGSVLIAQNLFIILR